MESFKWFLINEEKAFLGHRVGDVVTAVQDLQNDMGGMGTRQINRVAEDIVKQIRKILHSQWTPKQARYLKELQKIGVALIKCIEEKGDLKQLLPNVAQQLQDISGKLGLKVNNLQAPEEEGAPQGPDGQQMDMQLTGNGPQPPQPAGQQMAGGPPPQAGPPMPAMPGPGAPPAPMPGM